MTTTITNTVPATRSGARRKLKRIREAEHDLRVQHDHARQVLSEAFRRLRPWSDISDRPGVARAFARLDAIEAETERLRMLHDRIIEELKP